MIAQSAMGCRDTILQGVYVNPTPVVNISANAVCLGDEATFSNSTVPSNNTIVQWNWVFGDGALADVFEPSHTYSNYGPFTVELTAVSDSGCIGSSTTDIEVYPYPTAAFSSSDNEGCAPVEIAFEDESTIPANYSIANYQWIYGDGATGVGVNTSHTYNGPGIYDVSLVVTSAGGCVDTLTIADAMSIYVTPTPGFTYRPTEPSMLDPRIRFTNTTVNGISYAWEFGDGSSSTMVNPINTYMEEGDYLVTLTATNGICEATITENLHIDPVTFIYIPNSFTPNLDRLNDGFIPKGIGIQKFSMYIYDRWGKELYFTSNMDDPWNGIYKGMECPSDTYVYRVDIIDVKGENKSYCGSVNLIR